jgi:hypothetical protein
MKRSAFVRFLAILWATLQLASAGVASVADGMLAAASSSAPSTHVEAKTGAGCHAVHSPDCAVCRYLSHAAAQPSSSSANYELGVPGGKPSADYREAITVALALPHGRAPPTI